MKKTALSLLSLCLCCVLLLAACGETVPVPSETVPSAEAEATAAPDPTAASAGELALEDPLLRCDNPTADNYRVFYEIFVGSFSDSDGDGVGDLRGIIDRMDYLNDGDDNSGKSLGVEGIWLTPIFSSLSYHKYDVNDYYAVDEDFGTLDDLRELVALCHARNVKVILDLVINHTGKLNPWFTQFVAAHRAGDTQDPMYDFYCWYGPGDEAPAGRTFAQIAGTDEYYECNFSGDMPELNFDNEAVRQAVLDVAAFYLDLGVDGFRFDAAKYIYFGDNQRSAEFWAWYIDELRRLSPEIYTVAEVWDSDGVTDQYYPALNCFDFTTSQVNGLIAETAQHGDANRYTAYVDSYLDRVEALSADAMIVPFLTNHDMDRAAGFLTVASGQMKMAANLYVLSSGSPFLYYGEELGMRGSRGGASTDANRRLAMVWGDGDTVADPVGATYDPAKQVPETAADQLPRADSLYSYYKKLIMLRKANPEIARGEYTALSLPGTKVGGFLARWQGSTVCVLHNPTNSSVTLSLAELTDVPLTELRGFIGVEDAALSDGTLTLGAMTSAILRAG